MTLPQNIAVEIFCEDNRPYLFSLRSTTAVNKFIQRLRKLVPKQQAQFLFKRSHVVKALGNLQQLWTKREISNFEYLMRLNRSVCRFHSLGGSS